MDVTSGGFTPVGGGRNLKKNACANDNNGDLNLHCWEKESSLIFLVCVQRAVGAVSHRSPLYSPQMALEETLLPSFRSHSSVQRGDRRRTAQPGGGDLNQPDNNSALPL